MGARWFTYDRRKDERPSRVRLYRLQPSTPVVLRHIFPCWPGDKLCVGNNNKDAAGKPIPKTGGLGKSHDRRKRQIMSGGERALPR